jgi:hypothetical protein
MNYTKFYERISAVYNIDLSAGLFHLSIPRTLVTASPLVNFCDALIAGTL